MLKFLLIIGVVVYIIYKVGSFFFRAGAAAQQLRNFEQKQRNATSNTSHTNKGEKNPKFKGGEYVDYEEVK